MTWLAMGLAGILKLCYSVTNARCQPGCINTSQVQLENINVLHWKPLLPIQLSKISHMQLKEWIPAGSGVRTVERELENGGGVERECDLPKWTVLMQLEGA